MMQVTIVTQILMNSLREQENKKNTSDSEYWGFIVNLRFQAIGFIVKDVIISILCFSLNKNTK